MGWENTALCGAWHQLGCSVSPLPSSDGATNPSQRDKQTGAVCLTSSLSTIQGWVPLEGSHPWEHLLLLPQESSPRGRAPGHTQEPWGGHTTAFVFPAPFSFISRPITSHRRSRHRSDGIISRDQPQTRHKANINSALKDMLRKYYTQKYSLFLRN